MRREHDIEILIAVLINVPECHAVALHDGTETARRGDFLEHAPTVITEHSIGH